jgi:hypothetical protein
MIWPDKGWLFSGHPNKKSVGRDTAPIRCIEWVWGVGSIWNPATAKKGQCYPAFWKNPSARISMAFPRVGAGPCVLRQNYPLVAYRLNPEKTLQCGQHGIGRVGLDFWRYEVSPGRWRQLTAGGGQFTFNAGIAWLLAPGPDGPVSTTRCEMFREGLQVREAMIYLQKAVHGNKVSSELAAKITQLLTERARNMLTPGGHRRWRQNEDRLLALCATVSSRK